MKPLFSRAITPIKKRVPQKLLDGVFKLAPFVSKQSNKCRHLAKSKIDLLFYVLFLIHFFLEAHFNHLLFQRWINVCLVPNPLRNWLLAMTWESRFGARFPKILLPTRLYVVPPRETLRSSRGECCFLTQLLRPKVARKPARVLLPNKAWLEGRLITEILSLFCWPHCIDFSTTVTMTVCHNNQAGKLVNDSS